MSTDDGTLIIPQAMWPDTGTEYSFLELISTACLASDSNRSRWIIEADPGPRPVWIHVRHSDVFLPEQGWKLHISAGVSSAEAVLSRILSVLLREKAIFKVAVSAHVLASLNNGDAGLSQIGKFITVYPSDDQQAVRLAARLDEVTRGLRGPAVPSDRTLAPGSLVHYRYGSFGKRQIWTLVGQALPAIRTPEGHWIPDNKEAFYQRPKWAVDPFIAAGLTRTRTAVTHVICKRYLLIAKWHQSPRGCVHLAVDMTAHRRCVLKSAPRDAVLDNYGRDARDALRHEAAMLSLVGPDGRFPRIFDLFEWNSDLFLVLEDVEGQTLQSYVAELAAQGRNVGASQVRSWGSELAAMLQQIHARGLVYRDLAASNVIVTPDRTLRLIDFGLVHELGSGRPPFGQGTRGYMSPQQADRGPVTMADDIYSLGALLYSIATGVDPSFATNEFSLLDRPVELLNPAIGADLTAVIGCCLDADPSRRFPSAAAVGDALSRMVKQESKPRYSPADQFGELKLHARIRADELAHRLGDTLCAEMQLPTEGSRAEARDSQTPMVSCDLNSGAAGQILALAELVDKLGDSEHRAALATAAHRLLIVARAGESSLPGLYVGEAGVGAALLRAGQTLADADLIAAAEDCGRSVARRPHLSPDMFHGTAGRLRFHLLLRNETGALAHLRHAIDAGEMLLKRATGDAVSGLHWRIPPGYDGLSGETYLGYAHGAAGIADTLLDLFEATSDERFLAAAQSAGRRLMRSSVLSLDDESGLDWPTVEGGPLVGPFWCHGATGVGQFFLHAARLNALPGAGDVAARAARTAAYGARWANPTQCHGIAGNIEFLLDMFAGTGDDFYLANARGLAEILGAFATERHGKLRWPSESPIKFVPSYMNGYAGVATCLLRLGDPERSRLLIPQAFKRRDVT
jgi:hypothetical protein